MDWVSLELKQISCRHLKAFNFFQKLSVYAVVYVFDDEVKKNEQKQQKDEVKKNEQKQQKCQQRQKMPVDTEGGGNSEWNQPTQFNLKSISLPNRREHLFLKFKLRCNGIIKRTIGEVRVPLKDLIDEFNGSVKFVSYQIKTSNGEANGVLNFSYMINGEGKKEDLDQSKAELPSRTEKVCYPSLNIHVQSREKSLYPSLEEIRFPSSGTSPLKEFYTVPTLVFPSQLPVYAWGNGVYYHPPLFQAPRPYFYD